MAFIRFWNYNGHGYGLNVTLSNWADAQSYARSKGGYLVEINSANENNFVDEILSDGLTGLDDPNRSDPFDYADRSLEYVHENSVSKDGGGSYYVWTGGTDSENEGQWIWANSRSPISLSNPLWGSGRGVTEPDNSGSGQDYLGFGLHKWPLNADEPIGQPGEWNDIKGSSLLYSFVEFDYLVDESFGFRLGEDPKTVTDVNKYARDLLGSVYDAPITKAGSFYDFKIYDLGGGRYGIQSKGSNSIDEITNAQQVTFTDGVKSIASDIASTFDLLTGIDDVTGQCFRLYSAAFSRHPDPSGLKFWIDSSLSQSASLAQIATTFSSSPEFISRYGNELSDRDYISTLYNNVLGRLPDEGGFSFWQNSMELGSSRGDVLLEFSESGENKLLFSQLTGLG